MATPVIMPRQGQSVESCIISQWYKKLGDRVAVGDDLFSYETDKAAFDEAAQVDGEMLAIYFQENDDVPCLTNVCVIGEKGEDTSAFDPAGAGANAAESSAAAPTTSVAQPVAEVQQPLDSDIASISPRAKATARKHAADLRQVVPTGPKGRVIERDVFKLIDAGKLATGAVGSDYSPGIAGTGIGGRVAAADLSDAARAGTSAASATPINPISDFYEEKHTNIRKLIAKSMVQSLSTMAQLTYNSSFDATHIIEFRAKLKKAKALGLAEKLGIPGVVTVNDMILYAVSRVVKNHKMCNAHYFDDRMV
ncbi:MAG: E3 binding domain-containing protein, partial [Propionivibrio sp.]